MAEVMIVCAECLQDLEEFKAELMWGGLRVQVVPCQTCMDAVVEELT